MIKNNDKGQLQSINGVIEQGREMKTTQNDKEHFYKIIDKLHKKQEEYKYQNKNEINMSSYISNFRIIMKALEYVMKDIYAPLEIFYNEDAKKDINKPQYEKLALNKDETPYTLKQIKDKLNNIYNNSNSTATGLYKDKNQFYDAFDKGQNIMTAFNEAIINEEYLEYVTEKEDEELTQRF